VPKTREQRKDTENYKRKTPAYIQRSTHNNHLRFVTTNLQVRKAWNNTIQALREKNIYSRKISNQELIYAAKLSFNVDEEIKIF
jgi:hypothetical protein